MLSDIIKVLVHQFNSRTILIRVIHTRITIKDREVCRNVYISGRARCPILIMACSLMALHKPNETGIDFVRLNWKTTPVMAENSTVYSSGNTRWVPIEIILLRKEDSSRCRNGGTASNCFSARNTALRKPRAIGDHDESMHRIRGSGSRLRGTTLTDLSA